jgi:hypothetical protein
MEVRARDAVTAYKEIRADYDRDSIVVYQAYRPEIGEAAIAAQKFVPPFSFNRMTWIKPSFLWMMERCGWGEKAGQEVVLGVRIRRENWEAALSQAVLSDVEGGNALVRVQWDPERSLRGGKLEHRSIQVGLSRHLIRAYAEQWIVSIADLRPLVGKLRALRKEGRHDQRSWLVHDQRSWPVHDQAERYLPVERPYPVSEALARRLGM